MFSPISYLICVLMEIKQTGRKFFHHMIHDKTEREIQSSIKQSKQSCEEHGQKKT
jgi:hypothetical protein